MYNFKSVSSNVKTSIKTILILLISNCLLNCSTYKQHFGGKGHEYATARPGKKLQTASKRYPLKTSDRYTIPKIPGTWGGQVPELLPPDYLDQD